jgi:N-acetylglucosaminyl-diphospho-decaprenol L-rhamnosyltransferase
MVEAGMKSSGAAVAVFPEAAPLDISILIVTWNSERWIERCLRSIPAACAGLRFEVIVYDNASEDSTLQRVPSEDIRIVRGVANDGFAAGTNRAFSGSRGKYVFLLNPDCELAPGAVTSLMEFMASHPNAAAAAPLLEGDSGDSQRNFQLRRLPTVAALAAEALLFDKIFPKNRVTSNYRYHDLDLSKPQRVEQPAAAALLVRRDVFDEVGPLDEHFSPAWFEDVDYCRRLAEAGKELYVVPAARARHYGGASLDHMPYGRFIDLWYRNMFRYAQKWFSRGQAEALRWAIIAGMMMRCCATFAGFRNGSKSRWEAFRAYKTVLKKAISRWDET